MSFFFRDNSGEKLFKHKKTIMTWNHSIVVKHKPRLSQHVFVKLVATKSHQRRWQNAERNGMTQNSSEDLFIKRNMILYKIGTLILFSSLCCRNRIRALNILQSFVISVRWRFSTFNLWRPVVWPLKVLRFIIPHIFLLLGKYPFSSSAISLLGC